MMDHISDNTDEPTIKRLNNDEATKPTRHRANKPTIDRKMELTNQHATKPTDKQPE